MEFDKSSRRRFLKAGMAALTGVGGGMLLQFASCEQKQKSERFNYSIEDYVNAIIEIESSGNERAERYERHLNDYSYGLGQLLTKTAKNLEVRYGDLPRLGESREEIRENLFNPNVNRQYAQRLFEEELDFYKNTFLAVAAYNAGHFAPRNARCQEQLNDLYGTNLNKDGLFGEKSKEILKKFQEDYELEVDGRFGEQSYEKLQEVWQEKNSRKENQRGIIPQNRMTPRHVEKFKMVLERLKK